MRTVVACLAVIACGRVHFVPRDDASDGDGDGGGDANVEYCAQAIAVGTGRAHGCLVDPAGAVWCWGRNEHGQVDPSRADEYVLDPIRVALPGPATEVEAGRDTTCALLADATVHCWGSNAYGQVGDPATNGGTRQGPTRVEGVSALAINFGAQTVCAIEAADRSVACWGDSRHGERGAAAGSATPTTIAGTAGTKQVVVGHRHACMINASDDVLCWGRNGNSQLGTTGASRPDAQPVINAAKSRYLGLGGRTTCSATLTGGMQCWGDSNYGALGTGSLVQANTATASPFTGAVELEGSTFGMCARRADGTGACWGDIGIGDGTYAQPLMPRAWGSLTVTSLSSTYFYTCGIVDGQALCWGDNSSAQLGRGLRGVTPVPTAVSLGGRSVTSLAASNEHVCVVAGGEAVCWGSGSGALGNGSLDGTRVPYAVPTGLGTVIGVAAGEESGCAWSASAAKCWGKNESGQAGTNTMSTYEMSPAPVSLPTPIQQLVHGGSHGCALAAGEVRCWGRNLNGTVGNGTTMVVRTPVPTVPALTGITAIAAGLNHNCAITTLSTLYCWGEGDNFRLGNNNTLYQTTPQLIPVGGGLPIAEVSLGDRHSCAVTTGGALYCWGGNQSGQLGIPVNLAMTPQAVIASGVLHVRASEETTCAQMMSGEVQCWGEGVDGQRGDGSTARTPVTVPTAVPALAGVDDFVLGGRGGCARRGGSLECWGVDEMLGSGDASTATPQPPHVPCL